MLKAKFISVFIFFIFVISLASSAQRDEGFEMEEEMETVTLKKEITPKIHMWNVTGLGAFQDSTILDTLQNYFHIFHPVFKDALTASYVGNYGGAYLNNDFSLRKSGMNYLFLRSREAYLLAPEKIDYYNTSTPYTRLDFSQSENKSSKSETRFNILHSQNVTPYLNFTFRYDLANSMGQYNYQEGKNNFVTLYSSYIKDELSIHSGFVSNAIKNMENGGLAEESDLLTPEDSYQLKVNLKESNSQFNSTYFFTDAEYKLGKYEAINDSTDYFRPILGIIYSVKYERHKQEFIEEEQYDSIFWDNTYYDDDYRKDSIRYNIFSNTIQLKQYENANKKVTFGKRALLGYELIQGSTPGITGDIANRHIIKHSNLFLGGGIFRKTGSFWTWDFDGKIYLLGRRAGQTELKGIISKPFNFLGDSLAAIVFSGSIDNLVADRLEEEFYSNHVRWKNDFNMTQRMAASGKFVSAKRKLEIGARYEILNNYIYNDTLGIPTQTDKEMVILSAFLDKDFNYKNLHFRTRVLWQKPSNEELIHLPDLSVFVSAYFKFVVSKVLFSQIGFDTRYNTMYYADAYAPSTGLFHLQNDKEYGNFPYIDVYASIRLKRTRLFFKMMNIGSDFINKEYITTPNYPMNRSTFRLGVSWAFYD
ncbi:MAG: hypothetical protein GQ525_06690 [Draconibacterium sp.]|nr:hypothetical protein [Draconibacterium sp.]